MGDCSGEWRRRWLFGVIAVLQTIVALHLHASKLMLLLLLPLSSSSSLPPAVSQTSARHWASVGSLTILLYRAINNGHH